MATGCMWLKIRASVLRKTREISPTSLAISENPVSCSYLFIRQIYKPIHLSDCMELLGCI